MARFPNHTEQMSELNRRLDRLESLPGIRDDIAKAKAEEEAAAARAALESGKLTQPAATDGATRARLSSLEETTRQLASVAADLAKGQDRTMGVLQAVVEKLGELDRRTDAPAAPPAAPPPAGVGG